MWKPRRSVRHLGGTFVRGQGWGLALIVAAVIGLWGSASEARAQQRIGYIDTQSILEELPEYATVQQKLDKLEEEWRAEIQDQKERVQKLENEYQASRLLYTDKERKQKQKAIEEAQRKVEQLRQQYFGPEGELYTRQKQLMQPIQERILNATEEVATAEGFDYVFDKSEKVLFMYAREEYNLNDSVLRELGITPNQNAGRD